MFIVVSSLVLLFDQIFKFIANKYMFVNQSIPIIDGVVDLTYVQNTGAAFGILRGWRPLLIIIGVIVIFFLVYFLKKVKEAKLYQLPLALILGGSLGNLFDRIFRGFVIDYIDFKFWPVFNFADIMINLGFLLVVVKMIFTKEDGHAS